MGTGCAHATPSVEPPSQTLREAAEQLAVAGETLAALMRDAAARWNHGLPRTA
ncbi:hypothetical protein [Streptomyces decoyicus]|uniref:hypothetical protein n=1 Tax=Streptomyces decoyicus TaxID=249567 RepID=UPI0038665A98|nr:hypothetical protein OG532_10425 [Streptomyces decoyicus]